VSIDAETQTNALGRQSVELNVLRAIICRVAVSGAHRLGTGASTRYQTQITVTLLLAGAAAYFTQADLIIKVLPALVLNLPGTILPLALPFDSELTVFSSRTIGVRITIRQLTLVRPDTTQIDVEVGVLLVVVVYVNLPLIRQQTLLTITAIPIALARSGAEIVQTTGAPNTLGKPGAVVRHTARFAIIGRAGCLATTAGRKGDVFGNFCTVPEGTAEEVRIIAITDREAVPGYTNFVQVLTVGVDLVLKITLPGAAITVAFARALRILAAFAFHTGISDTIVVVLTKCLTTPTADTSEIAAMINGSCIRIVVTAFTQTDGSFGWGLTSCLVNVVYVEKPTGFVAGTIGGGLTLFECGAGIANTLWRQVLLIAIDTSEL